MSLDRGEEEILWDENFDGSGDVEGAIDPLGETLELQLKAGVRLDQGVSEVLSRSRSFVQGLIEQGLIHVNGSPKKANYKVRTGDQVIVQVPPPRELQVHSEDIPLNVIYEDQDVLVVNKGPGMVVHPAPGSWTGTLVNALLHHCTNLSGINGVLRPGIVHRIDKDTSGLLVVAKSDQAHQGLAEQIKEHRVERRYVAIVHGRVQEPSGTIDAPIGRDPGDRKKMAVVFANAKSARTHYEVLERFADFTLIRANLETGRTHQIRVHMAYLKHPVLGDPLYGPKRNPFHLTGQLLHAETLIFTHPVTGVMKEFTVPYPEHFLQVLEELRGNI